jgi:carbamate kinase
VIVVVALGGHALLRAGQELTIDNQRDNVRKACASLAPVASDHELAITHGNGPQVGLVALQSVARKDIPPFPLDILDAETQGMIGYLIEQELGNCSGADTPVTTLLTMVEVDPHDPAFDDPTKPIGPYYDEETADSLARELGWVFKRRGDSYRRVVPSPAPKRILELRQIASLLERRCAVVCGGGGGIPVAPGLRGVLEGIEAVVDKDSTTALLATELHADFLAITTDVDAAYLDWGKPTARPIRRARPDMLMKLTDHFEAGSMLPKVVAASQFVTATGKAAAIGDLTELAGMLQQRAGTIVSLDAEDIELDR